MKSVVVCGSKLTNLLVANSDFQSFKLKKRLFNANIKRPVCKICEWNQGAPDGRIPVEFDHINRNHRDNRLENLLEVRIKRQI